MSEPNQVIVAYIATLKREEQAYAASYAHWLDIDGDTIKAADMAFASRSGIRPSRRTAIRRKIVELWCKE